MVDFKAYEDQKSDNNILANKNVLNLVDFSVEHKKSLIKIKNPKIFKKSRGF
jgi:hypothetical protein